MSSIFFNALVCIYKKIMKQKQFYRVEKKADTIFS